MITFTLLTNVHMFNDFLLMLVQAVEELEDLVEKGSETMDVRNKEQVVSRMKAAVASKQFGQEDILCNLGAEASIFHVTQSVLNWLVDEKCL